ncbi:MAG: SPASM domain-containing protein [Magnetococcales bacterium]|nr:SPASM domain-containing protein [Magnetococcales bacterium]
MSSWILRQLQNTFVYKPIIEQKAITVIDPPLFDTVFFEVRTRCNGECAFCLAAVKTDPRKDEVMSPELHKKVLQELRDINFQGRIAYHNNSDPLIFKDLAEFIAVAKEIFPQNRIQILTNGKALSLKKAEKLIQVGVNELIINHYHDDLNTELPKAFLEIATSILPKYFSQDELTINGIEPKLASKNPLFIYKIVRREVSNILTSRAGTSPNKKEPTPKPRGFCQFPWTQFIITANGRVALCCNDVLFVEDVGNVIDESVMDVWRGAKFQHYREKLIKGERHAIPNTCAKCDNYGIKKPKNTWLAKKLFKYTK